MLSGKATALRQKAKLSHCSSTNLRRRQICCWEILPYSAATRLASESHPRVRAGAALPPRVWQRRSVQSCRLCTWRKAVVTRSEHLLMCENKEPGGVCRLCSPNCHGAPGVRGAAQTEDGSGLWEEADCVSGVVPVAEYDALLVPRHDQVVISRRPVYCRDTALCVGRRSKRKRRKRMRRRRRRRRRHSF